MSFYLTSRCPEMTSILQWAEQEETEITDEVIRQYGHMGELDGEDVVHLNRHLWGFLNINVTDDAWEVFENVDRGQGFEAWRKVLHDVVKKTRAEKIKMERIVLNPPQCSNIEQIPMALERWETAHKNYREAGGTALDDDRKKGALIGMLPWSLQEKVLWDFDDHKDVHSLVSWLKAKVRVTSSWKAGGRETHVITDEDELREEIQALGAAPTEDQMVALFQNRRGLKPRDGTGWPSGPRGRPGQREDKGPPRSKDDITCANCLKKGHPATDCPAPKVKREDRKCFECGEPGHEARRCPKRKPRQPAKTVDTEPIPNLLITDDDGYIPVQRRRQARAQIQESLGITIEDPRAVQGVPEHKSRPLPRGATLGSFIHESFFKALEQTEEPSDQDKDYPDLQVVPPVADGSSSRGPRCQDRRCRPSSTTASTPSPVSGEAWDPPLTSCQAKHRASRTPSTTASTSTSPSTTRSSPQDLPRPSGVPKSWGPDAADGVERAGVPRASAENRGSTRAQRSEAPRPELRPRDVHLAVDDHHIAPSEGAFSSTNSPATAASMFPRLLSDEADETHR